MDKQSPEVMDRESPAVVDRRSFLVSGFAAGFAGWAALQTGGLWAQGGKSAESAAVGAAFSPERAGAFYPFQVGEIPGVVLSDGNLALRPVDSVLVGDKAVQAEASALLADHFLPTDRLEAELNTVVFRTGDKVVLIDVGAGDSFGPTGGRQAAVLAAAGLKPADVTTIFITHAHGDHFGGYLGADGKPVYANAELVISEKEHAFWTQDKAPVEALQKMLDGAKKNFAAAGDRVRLIKPGSEIAPGITAVEAYGHTPGHCQVRVDSGKESLLVTGDTANHPVLFLRHPEWGFGFDGDKPAAAATRKKTLEAAAADRMRILAYHFPYPGIGRVRKLASGGFEFVAEPMKL